MPQQSDKDILTRQLEQMWVTENLCDVDEILSSESESENEDGNNDRRVSREAFQEIKDHQVFSTKQSGNEQFLVQDQLAIALYRFRRYDNAASVGNVSRHFGLAEGTIVLFTERVMQAVHSLRYRYLR